ncbi:type II secretion system protein E [Leptotrichia hofstadii]|jgi:general secretion pathway protein E|uniref:Type II/IV secretion system protein n=2 Tax=Leptotrichia hofstadii TaxID=157688 RepID=C9N0N1_9FUSO|nr:GspE/PulE family protein [Leptotrichia hofstadii]EEX73718.1 type II/IV secretion system protein [Leptotrichia hofstadii F0254]BBM37582.1 type II secretion system protein E [Leptotrichia hofstadii]
MNKKINEKLNEKVKLKDFADNKNNILSNDTVSYLNEIVKAGFKERASDIHIKFDLLEGMEIKYRVDGYLMESQQLYETVNKKVLEKNITEIIARIKILAGMNVAEKRKPQDGSFSFLFNIKNLNKRYDIRAAYMPTIGGETMVLRILENYLEDINLETLGFSNQSIAMLKEILTRKYGMILVSGPTGSGKSTTLKSLITMLNDGRKKIITVEDPVESKIEGIVQVQVNQNIGVTFAEVLKATLRNDPDIIVISEIRDEVTAEIAVRAALTGHLVISTIHTNDAVSTLIRLVDMGIPKYLILDSLIGVIGQRLVGKKCQKCMGEGCSECSNGYSGRISINEVLVLNQDVRNILKEDNHLGSETKNKLKMLNQKSKNQKHFIDFMEDADEKIEKNLIFEREKTSIIF